MGINNNNWKEFFFNSNEGLGTLYDRVILERFFDRFITEYKIKNALDCPSFGMTGFSGLNSLYLAKKGVSVTVCDDNPERFEWIETLWNKIGFKADFIRVKDYSHLPFDTQSFDLVWNLSALWYLKDYNISSVIKELGRVTKKGLFISIHNKKQLFYPIWKMLEPDFFLYVKEDSSDEKILERSFNDVLNEFSFKESGYFVTTPWPGAILKKEQIFDKILGRKSPKNKMEHIHQLSDIKIPTYVNHLTNQKLNEKIENLMFLERLPNALKKYWAHLKYWIFIRQSEEL